MQPTADVHAQTVAMISDAVTDITRRAVAPTLEPFQRGLNGVVGRIGDKLEQVDELLVSARADRTALLTEIGRLNDHVADLARAHAHSSDQLDRLRVLVIWCLIGIILGAVALVLGAFIYFGRSRGF